MGEGTGEVYQLAWSREGMRSPRKENIVAFRAGPSWGAVSQSGGQFQYGVSLQARVLVTLNS